MHLLELYLVDAQVCWAEIIAVLSTSIATRTVSCVAITPTRLELFQSCKSALIDAGASETVYTFRYLLGLFGLEFHTQSSDGLDVIAVIDDMRVCIEVRAVTLTTESFEY